MLMPKRVKRRKQFRGSMRGKALRGNKINYGEFHKYDPQKRPVLHPQGNFSGYETMHYRSYISL